MSYSTVGHHGTTREAAHSILNSQFEISRRDNLWLGDGVYFFDKDVDMAFEWCKAEGNRLHYYEYAILESSLSVNETKVLNLSTQTGAYLFHAHRDIMVERMRKACLSVRSINKETSDGNVLNELCSLPMFEIDVITLRCFVRKVKDRMRKVNSNVPNCEIICIRNLDCIRATRLKDEGDLRV